VSFPGGYYEDSKQVSRTQLSCRYHINCVDITETPQQGSLKLDHNPHCDAVRTDSTEEEKLTERAVATITINAPQAEIDAFKKMIKAYEMEVPRKTGDPDYDFEETVGKANYAPSLFISTTKQNKTARRINREFLDVIRNAGYVIKELDGEYGEANYHPRNCGCHEIMGRVLIHPRAEALGYLLQGGAPKTPVFWEVKFIKKRISILPKILMPDRWR